MTPQPRAEGEPLFLRPPAQVMHLARLGAMHQTPLSFLRIMLRRVIREGWRFSIREFEFDAAGNGHAVLLAQGVAHSYALIAYARDLPPELRTDRVIAQAWDTSYVLFDGIPGKADIDYLRNHVPHQEAGRYRASELILSRANKSVRLFDSVVSALARGEQPNARALAATGYLMRTTAVYGNGKFGIADRDVIADRPEFAAPFQAEMLNVWLVRWFTVLYAEDCAAKRAPGRAVRLSRELRRMLGVGNATGLGMAPFLIKHPALIGRWFATRESALAQVLAREAICAAQWADFMAALARARDIVSTWHTEDAEQAGRIRVLDAELARLAAQAGQFNRPGGWKAMFQHVGDQSLEMQEMLVSLLMEPHPDIMDACAGQLSIDEAAYGGLDGAMPAGVVKALLERHYAWALGLDFTAPAAQARFWYVSEEKLEPRLGFRQSEPGTEREHPLAIARDAQALVAALEAIAPEAPIALLLMQQPELRHMLRRVQIIDQHPYGEIRDNLIDENIRPIDLLRAKLAFFGAQQFDPKSDLWLRINLFRGEIFPDEISA